MQTIDRADLLNILDTAFHDEEARDLVFSLGQDWDNLSGSNKRGRLGNLILYYERQREVDKLISAVRERGPNRFAPDSIYVESQPEYSAPLSPAGAGIGPQAPLRLDKLIVALPRRDLFLVAFVLLVIAGLS